MEITTQIHHVMGSEYYSNDRIEEYWRRQQERSATAAAPEQAPRAGATSDARPDPTCAREAEAHRLVAAAGVDTAGVDTVGVDTVGAAGSGDASPFADSDVEVEGGLRADAAPDGDGDSSSYASAEAEPEVESSATVDAATDADITVDVEADGSSYASAEADGDVESSNQNDSAHSEAFAFSGVSARAKSDVKSGSSQTPPLTYTKIVIKNRNLSVNDVLASSSFVGSNLYNETSKDEVAVDANSEETTRAGRRALSVAGGVAAATYEDVVNGSAADIIVVSGDSKETADDSCNKGVAAGDAPDNAEGDGEGEGGDGGYGSGGDGDGDGVHAGPRTASSPLEDEAPAAAAAAEEEAVGEHGAVTAGAAAGAVAGVTAARRGECSGEGDVAAAAQREYDKAGGCAGDGVHKGEEQASHDAFNKCATTCTICGTTSSHPLSALAEPWYPRSYTQLYVQANMPVDKM